MKKIDFTKIEIRDIEDKTQTVSVTKDLGNTLYMRGADIVACQTGKKIYYSEGPIQLNDDEVNAVKGMLDVYPYIIKEGIVAALDSDE